MASSIIAFLSYSNWTRDHQAFDKLRMPPLLNPLPPVEGMPLKDRKSTPATGWNLSKWKNVVVRHLEQEDKAKKASVVGRVNNQVFHILRSACFCLHLQR